MEKVLDAVLPRGSELFSIPQKENEIINIKNFKYECDKATNGYE